MPILENLENSWFDDFEFNLKETTGIHDTLDKQLGHACILAGDDKSQTDQDKI